MTWTAPTDRTMSTFLVLQTPVTSAPNDLAICTAKVPTPPDAPLIKTRCPGWTRLPSHQFRRPPPRNREPRWSEDPILAGTGDQEPNLRRRRLDGGDPVRQSRRGTPGGRRSTCGKGPLRPRSRRSRAERRTHDSAGRSNYQTRLDAAGTQARV